MDVFSTMLLLMPTVAFRRATLRQLAASGFTNEYARIWQRTVALQAELSRTRPRYSFGVNRFLRFMEWDAALYRALQEHGVPHAQAGQLIEAINWQLFGAGTSNVFRLSRLRSATLSTRIRWVLDLMFAVLFTHPFRKQDLPAAKGIAFEVTHCPVADYFKQQGLPELTRYAACNLDHRMAQVWHTRLQRTHTIAEGSSSCDFRFHLNEEMRES
jgi:hypothetical protein